MQRGMSITGIIVCVSISVGITGAQSTLAAPREGPVKFMQELLQKHVNLLSEQEKQAFDEINRQLREADEEQRRGKTDQEKKAGEDKLAAASDKLAGMLEKSQKVNRLTIQGDKVEPSLHGPYTLPDDSGAILFRVQSGQGGTVFHAYDLNVSENHGEVWIDCAPAGTTWALLGFNRLPVQRTTFVVALKRQGMKDIKSLMEVVTPLEGRLKVTILAAESGRPVPAMVRITARSSGRDRRPSTAIELAPQFDSHGRPSGQRNANLPGRLGGDWWIVPEAFDMTLAPGDYDIAVRRGVEHIPIYETLSVASGKRTEKTYRVQRWVDMRNLGWYSGDDHVHCQILSDDDAERVMAWVQAEDIHLANVVKMGDIFRTWFEQRGFGKEYRVIKDDYVLSPGQECPRTHDQIGHTIAMNTTSMVRDTDRYYLYDWVADTVHAQGGLWGFAHVNSGIFWVHRGMSFMVPMQKTDFVEILQFTQLGTELYYDFLNAGFKLTASAGSDVPWGGTVGEVRIYAYIGSVPFTADAWFDAMGRGRTFVTNGPMVEFRVEDAYPGDEIVVEQNRKLRVKARTWGHPERGRPEMLEIVRHGDVLRSARPADDQANEISMDFEVDADHGFWIAARAKAVNGTVAHTTPVYVVRKGLRFWRYGDIQDLLTKRTDSLKQIEQLVAEAQEKQKDGSLDADQTVGQLAKQGADLMERVRLAHKIIQDLRETARNEASIRSGSN